MSSKGKKNQSEGGLLESPEALVKEISRSEEFLNKHKVLTYAVVAGLLIVVGGIVGFRYYKTNLNEQAQSEMFQAVYYFEQDSLNLALRGDGNNLGFVDIAEDYSNSKAGNLANFYAGSVYLKQGKYDLALLYLQDFSSNDLLVQGRAYSLIGDVYMEQSNYAEAVKAYEQAANYKPNKHFTPQYLIKVALAYEKLNDLEKAKKAYQQIVEKYWESEEYQYARKNLARLGGIES
ncbi:MAG: tetratricopeptide repeat protein [Cyclobacteriaceae bacterium]|nr:tetratricopeptide repeat protein [Cyclobacteriaceae bacterium]